MKIVFSVLYLVLFCSNSFSQETRKFEVLERKNKSNKIRVLDVFLDDLVSADSFDGKYFKIVLGKNSSAIRFDEPNQLIVRKAANVYYHLSKARNFWNKKFHLPQSEKKYVIRLEITNQFDELGHFAHDNRSPQFNNAVSVPSGESPDWIPAEKQRKWYNEIWFRPMKKIDVNDLPDLGPNPLTVSLQALEEPFLNYTRNNFNQSILEHIFYPTYAANPLWVDVIRFAGTIALTKVVIEGTKLSDRLFVEKYYYLDTAMIPEVIYHEYAHVMLSDHLELFHSTPVVEGFADYFAAIMSNKKLVYAPVKGFGNASGKEINSKKKYSHWYEANRMASSDFVLSVLWDVRKTLGPHIADKLIFDSRTLLKTQSATISHHLIEAILATCDSVCEEPRRDRLLLYEKFSLKGF
jgi:hypothetical protein